MKLKPLIFSLTAGTAIIWIAWALVAVKTAATPLFGLLPLPLWTSAAFERRYLLLIPLLLYLCVPVLAWAKNSTRLAWCIPVAPLVGAALFQAQLGFARLVVQSVSN
jgi:hypothetical protein